MNDIIKIKLNKKNVFHIYNKRKLLHLNEKIKSFEGKQKFLISFNPYKNHIKIIYIQKDFVIY